METVAVIIARGGSRRLPRKNVKKFCGIPLVAWSIMQAQESRLIDGILLSTDDDEIADIGKQWDCEVLRRPDWPDADLVSAGRVYAHAIGVVEELGWRPKQLVQMLPTSPLRRPGELDRAVMLQMQLGAQILGMCRRRETFLYEKVHPMIVRARIMDKFQLYYDVCSGAIAVCPWNWYIPFYTSFRSDHDADLNQMMRDPDHYPQVDSCFLELAPWQMWEVDTEEEFETAELLMEKFILQGEHPEVVFPNRRTRMGLLDGPLRK